VTEKRARRQPTELEAKALAHTLRQQIVRLCGAEELTNKELADRLGAEPGTVLPHVRMLVEAGFLEAAPVRSGASGALEKPYRTTGKTWWLDDPLSGAEPDVRFGPVTMAMDEAREAGGEGVATYATFLLHLSKKDVEELDRRLLEVIDEYIESDHTRTRRPVHRGFFVVHRVPPSAKS
jgi:predicted ArsR family transcriptional regulator